jgi:D-alanyl-D-alanine dipeptidase
MRGAIALFVLLASCATSGPAHDLPIDAIRASLRAECEDSGLGTLAIAIALPREADLDEGLAVIEIDAGAPLGPGARWRYGVPDRPIAAKDRGPAPRLDRLARNCAKDREPRRSEPGESDRGSSCGAWPLKRPGAAIAVATDRWPAHAVLERVARRIDALLEGDPDALLVEPLSELPRPRLRALLGRYEAGASALEIVELDGGAWLVPDRGAWLHLRSRADGVTLLARDRLHVGTSIAADGESVTLEGVRHVRATTPIPACPAGLVDLLGEYRRPGAHHASRMLLERHGRLRVIDDELVEHDARGDPSVLLAGYERVPTTAGTFRITPLHPPDELRRLAAAAEPPLPPRDALPFDLVELRELEPSIRYDIRYAGDDNFMGFALYTEASARMQRPAAEAVVRVHRAFAAEGLGVVVHDAWRPWRVTKMFWDATPEHQHTFVADPGKGSRHNRGCAIDLSLFELASGRVVEMPSGYDEFTERAYPHWPGGTGASRDLRDRLRHAMEDEGFAVYDAEWWHYDYPGWERYPVR